jgi:helix-turn-helix protein
MKSTKDHDVHSNHPDLKKTAFNGSTNIASMLTPAQAAAILHVEPRTLEGWRRLRTGPRYFRYSGRCVRYRPEDLREWLDGHAIDTRPS